jgi:hypothetical protein
MYACDAAWAALFTPRHPVAGRYEVCVTAAPLDEVLVGAGGELHLSAVEAVDPLDAFGAAGPYDRSALSRLFGGRRARVAHGWQDDGHRLISVTYVSPHPDRTFTTLEAGTLVIRYVVENRGL